METVTEQEIPTRPRVRRQRVDHRPLGDQAVLNYDPLGPQTLLPPASSKRPGPVMARQYPRSSGIQQMCNAAARALANNMGLASGPLVEVNIERLAGNEKVTTLRPLADLPDAERPVGFRSRRCTSTSPTIAHSR